MTFSSVSVDSKCGSDMKMKIACQDLQWLARSWKWVNVSQKEVYIDLGDFSFSLYVIKRYYRARYFSKDTNCASSDSSFTR